MNKGNKAKKTNREWVGKKLDSVGMGERDTKKKSEKNKKKLNKEPVF